MLVLPVQSLEWSACLVTANYYLRQRVGKGFTRLSVQDITFELGDLLTLILV